jgi:uncharacterized protein YceK
MRRVILVLAISLLAGGCARALRVLQATAGYAATHSRDTTTAAPATGTAMFVREIDTGGFTKQCVYDFLGSTHVKTVSSTSICPLTIQVSLTGS